ncbi:autophagy protein 5 [Claviceps humidiphila]|uniref:Autophagy protein 5 n=1 Tax=Claviceps humidiphila TaxID=1294629 RepID=A0A9P7U0E9_9HYPO|nr:autophagy protein 5 [Claviceps humidiphila]
MSSSPVSQALWDARIPLHITHASSSSSSLSSPTATTTPPFITSVPRFSYLALLLPRLTAYFNLPSSSFHFQDIQLRNLPIGLLTDLYQPPLPFRLIVSDGPAWDIADTFLNSVKEADYVRNGNANQIMKMSKEHTTQLWHAVLDNDYAAFRSVNARLLNAPVALRHVPLRVYVPSPPPAPVPAAGGSSLGHEAGREGEAGSFRVVQALVSAVGAADGRPRLLGQALKELMPRLFPSARDPVLAGVVLHGVGVPFEAPLGELMREAAYPDGWLCLVVTV